MPRDLFAAWKPVIGMLHAPALPGSPRNQLGFDRIVAWVLADAKVLLDAGLDALLLENFGDVPFYPGAVPPHTIAFMTSLAREVRSGFDLPLGINVLRNDAMASLAVAAATGAEFIRVNIHTGARLTDQGVIQGTAHETIRYRQTLGPGIRIFADVDVKHSSPLAPRSLENEVEETLSRGGADGVIVTGSATGKAAPLEDVRTAKRAAGTAPVIVGSGVDIKSLGAVFNVADGVIVGTAFKQDGITIHPIDPARVHPFMEAVRRIRQERGPSVIR